MLRTLSFVAAFAAALAISSAAWSGGSSGGHSDSGSHRDDHRASPRMGGAQIGSAPMKNVGSSTTARNSGVVQGPSGPSNVASSGTDQRHAYDDRRRFRHHRWFGSSFFAGAAIGYDDNPCWRWVDVPTPSGWTTRRLWVCDASYDEDVGR